MERVVIVIGGSHHNTLGVIRSLGRKGIFPYVILTSGGLDSFVLKSKYIQESWFVKGSDKVIDLLMEKFTPCSSKHILIGCHDAIASVFDLNKNKLSPYFVVPGAADQNVITPLMNKKNMGDLAERVGLLVPRMVICNLHSCQDLENSFYPCISKPIDSKSGSKSDIRIFENESSLKLFLTNKENRSFVIQQYINKDFEFQLIGCSLNSGNDIIIPGVSVILRQSKSSNTGFLRYQALDNSYSRTVEKTKQFIRNIGYSGLFSVEFLRDKKGNDYFLEINFRNDGNTISVENAGVNLPYIWYLYGIEADYKEEIKPVHTEYVMPEFAELMLYEQGLITYKEWKEDLRMTTSYMDYASDDPKPTDGWEKYNKLKSLSFLKHCRSRFCKLLN